MIGVGGEVVQSRQGLQTHRAMGVNVVASHAARSRARVRARFGAGAARLGALATALALCWILAPAAAVWGLSAETGGAAAEGQEALVVGESAGGWGESLVRGGVDGGGEDAPAAEGEGDLVAGRLKLGLGRDGEVELSLFSKTGGLLNSGALRGGEGGFQQGELWALGGQYNFVGLGGRATSGVAAAGLAEDEAASYRLSYNMGALTLGGNLLQVGSRFALSEGGGSTSAEEAESLKEALGKRNVELSAALSLAPGASFTTRHNSVRNDRPGDDKRGLTTTDLGHTLEWGVGSRSQLTASLEEHSEEWDQAQGKPDVKQRRQRVELKSAFGQDGQHGLRLGLTSTETETGEGEQSERVREAHLNLAPTTRLQLNADYVARGAGEGSEQTTQSVGGVLQLSSDAQLSAAITREAAEGNGKTRASSLKLTTKLGAGMSSGELVAEEQMSRGEGLEFVKQRNWALTGGLGTGWAKANLQANLEEKRGEGPSGQFVRKALVHVDRALARGVKLTAERRLEAGGTMASPEEMVKSSCGVEAELGPKTRMSLGLVSEQKPSGADGWAQQIALGHELNKVQLRAERQAWGEADRELSVLTYGVDAPIGELADWAKEISGAHEFGEAEEYLVRTGPDWTDMPFAGYRVWAKQRRGGDDDGLDTMGFAHRRMVADRYHLRLTYEERPECLEDDGKGRPMALQRRQVEIGMPVWRGLTARGSYQTESSLSDAGGRRQGGSLGLWGRLSERERVEASVSRDGGRWEGEMRQQTSVSVLYSLEVSDEHKLHVKVGYAWADDETSGRQREKRVSLGYVKSI